MITWEYVEGFIGKGRDLAEFLNEHGTLGWEAFRIEDIRTPT